MSGRRAKAQRRAIACTAPNVQPLKVFASALRAAVAIEEFAEQGRFATLLERLMRLPADQMAATAAVVAARSVGWPLEVRDDNQEENSDVQ